MFKQLLKALTSTSTLDRAFDDLNKMLEHSAWMFEQANQVLHSRIAAEDVRDSIARCDKQINELERSIRRKVLRYLTVNPGYDVAACLALMSVAKDAERIGDYCKNVFDVGRFYSKGFNVPKYQQRLDHIYDRTTELFKLVQQSCRQSSEGSAREALEAVPEIARECDQVITDLFRDEDRMEMHEAVAYSLLARHYKRVAAHLSNIATAMLGQFEDLDFYPDPGDQ